MAATSSSALKIQKLTDEATRAATACGQWLCTAQFRTFENYEICADNNGVVAKSQEFLKHFEPLPNVRPLLLCVTSQMLG
jgi:hypothetical protein